jgi:hypothetical protein
MDTNACTLANVIAVDNKLSFISDLKFFMLPASIHDSVTG